MRTGAKGWMATVVLLVATACASTTGGSGGSAAGDAPGSSTPPGAAAAASAAGTAVPTTTTAPLPPEQFSGALDDFYRVPDPLPEAAPGTLIRTMPVRDESDGSRTIRVMYHSRDARDRDRAVTGTITYPTTGTPPAGGWPVIAWAHGTTGLSTTCAPSRKGGAAPAWGLTGVRVATDYVGLGPIGERHPYLSGLSEGRSVIDAVRAARLLPDAHAGTTWVAAGHSQGGQAALWTNQLGSNAVEPTSTPGSLPAGGDAADDYAPELDLRGTVTIAPASGMDRTFGPNDQLVPRMVGLMALYGISTDWPDLDPNEFVGPEVQAAAPIIDTGCLDDIVKAMLPIPVERFWAQDPTKVEPAASAFRANDPGHLRVESPLLLVYGTADTYVVPARAEFLRDQLCGLGQVTDVVRLEGATHDSEPRDAAPQIGRWLADRLAGTTAPNACP